MRACASRSRGIDRSLTRSPSSPARRPAHPAAAPSRCSPSSSRRSVTVPAASSRSPMITANAAPAPVGHPQLRLQRPLLERRDRPARPPRGAPRPARGAASRAPSPTATTKHSQPARSSGGATPRPPAPAARARAPCRSRRPAWRAAERLGQPVVPAAAEQVACALRTSAVAHELERGPRVVVEPPDQRRRDDAAPYPRRASPAGRRRSARGTASHRWSRDPRARPAATARHASSLQSRTRSGLSRNRSRCSSRSRPGARSRYAISSSRYAGRQTSSPIEFTSQRGSASSPSSRRNGPPTAMTSTSAPRPRRAEHLDAELPELAVAGPPAAGRTGTSGST